MRKSVLINFLAISIYVTPISLLHSAERSLCVAHMNYLSGSSVTPQIEALVRTTLIEALSQNPGFDIEIKQLTRTINTLHTHQDSIKSLVRESRFLLTGQIDIIGQTSWILSFSIMDLKIPGRDTTFNANADEFNLEGTLDDILKSGVLRGMSEKIVTYLNSQSGREIWWKSPRTLIAGGMVGASIVGYIIYEAVNSGKNSKSDEDTDVPFPPGPP